MDLKFKDIFSWIARQLLVAISSSKPLARFW